MRHREKHVLLTFIQTIHISTSSFSLSFQETELYFVCFCREKTRSHSFWCKTKIPESHFKPDIGKSFLFIVQTCSTVPEKYKGKKHAVNRIIFVTWQNLFLIFDIYSITCVHLLVQGLQMENEMVIVRGQLRKDAAWYGLGLLCHKENSFSMQVP